MGVPVVPVRNLRQVAFRDPGAEDELLAVPYEPLVADVDQVLQVAAFLYPQ